jgi:hypothetical protein
MFSIAKPAVTLNGGNDVGAPGAQGKVLAERF